MRSDGAGVSEQCGTVREGAVWHSGRVSSVAQWESEQCGTVGEGVVRRVVYRMSWRDTALGRDWHQWIHRHRCGLGEGDG